MVENLFMKQMEITEFKGSCLTVLDWVAQTRQPVLVTRRGEPIARIVPATPGAGARWLGSMKGSVTIHGDIVAPTPPVADTAASWSSPVSDAVAWRGIGPEDARAAAIDDLEPRVNDACR